MSEAAEILDETPPPRPGPHPMHPYDEWFDGQTRALVPGTHFECDYPTFRTRIYGAAQRRGLRASVWVGDDGRVRVAAFPIHP